MLSRVLFSLLIAGLITTAVPACTCNEEMVTAAKSIQALRKDLEAGKIKAIRILFVSHDFESYVYLRPDDLQRIAPTNELHQMNDSLRNSLIRAIDNSQFCTTNDPADVRWGGILYDESDKEIHSIYLGKEHPFGRGRRILVDGNLARPNAALVTWFERTFRKQMGTVGAW